jgi:hypothetical protein
MIHHRQVLPTPLVGAGVDDTERGIRFGIVGVAVRPNHDGVAVPAGREVPRTIDVESLLLVSVDRIWRVARQGPHHLVGCNLERACRLRVGRGPCLPAHATTHDSTAATADPDGAGLTACARRSPGRAAPARAARRPARAPAAAAGRRATCSRAARAAARSAAAGRPSPACGRPAGRIAGCPAGRIPGCPAGRAAAGPTLRAPRRSAGRITGRSAIRTAAGSTLRASGRSARRIAGRPALFAATAGARGTVAPRTARGNREGETDPGNRPSCLSHAHHSCFVFPEPEE